MKLVTVTDHRGLPAVYGSRIRRPAVDAGSLKSAILLLEQARANIDTDARCIDYLERARDTIDQILICAAITREPRAARGGEIEEA